jgi:hypothetical protein
MGEKEQKGEALPEISGMFTLLSWVRGKQIL